MRYEGVLMKLSPNHPVFKHRIVRLQGNTLEYRKSWNGASTGHIPLENAQVELRGTVVYVHTPDEDTPHQLQAGSMIETIAWFEHIKAAMREVASGGFHAPELLWEPHTQISGTSIRALCSSGTELEPALGLFFPPFSAVDSRETTWWRPIPEPEGGDTLVVQLDRPCEVSGVKIQLSAGAPAAGWRWELSCSDRPPSRRSLLAPVGVVHPGEAPRGGAEWCEIRVSPARVARFWVLRVTGVGPNNWGAPGSEHPRVHQVQMLGGCDPTLPGPTPDAVSPAYLELNDQLIEMYVRTDAENVVEWSSVYATVSQTKQGSSELRLLDSPSSDAEVKFTMCLDQAGWQRSGFDGGCAMVRETAGSTIMLRPSAGMRPSPRSCQPAASSQPSGGSPSDKRPATPCTPANLTTAHSPIQPAHLLQARHRSQSNRDLPSSHLKVIQRLSLIHISEPTRLLSISYAVFCLKKKKKPKR
eukprot:TRINITY_DN28049_c0_g2_i1.p1 TRINITY_DN28049_c0_g2~~TRINITY_DN28049_c0_g2_i1.p1  ORF type:complete len:471 (-),score=86.99 TRINITY_DN28049_c0_g2_i1:97-1509(-)